MQGVVGFSVILYSISAVVFYFSQDQSIWSKGPALYALATQYVIFLLLLGMVIVYTLYYFFSSTTVSLGWYYYVMVAVVVVNFISTVTLFVIDTNKYPESKQEMSTYVGKAPVGAMLLVSEFFKKDSSE